MIDFVLDYVDIRGFRTNAMLSTELRTVVLLSQDAVGVSPGRGLKLFGREIIFAVFQPVWKMENIPQRHGRKDRQTDDMQSHNRARSA